MGGAKILVTVFGYSRVLVHPDGPSYVPVKMSVSETSSTV